MTAVSNPKLPLKLQELRQAAALTQSEVAERLFVTRQTVSKWETGVNLPDLEMIVALCDIYGASLDAVLRPDAELVAAIAQRQRVHKRLVWTVAILTAVIVAFLGVIQLGVAPR
jgi:transcriptional regulator with XRE-family HTH domain